MTMDVWDRLGCHVSAVVIGTRGMCIVLLAMLSSFLTVAPSAQGHGEERLNTRLVGTDDLQARSAYQPFRSNKTVATSSMSGTTQAKC